MKSVLALLFALSLTGCVVDPYGPGKAGHQTALICHKGKKTMELPHESIQAHLDHGDRLGPC